LHIIALYYPDLCITMILAFHLTELSSRQIFLKDTFTRCTVEGNKKCYRLPNGLRHREYDLPATIYSNGKQEWWYNGFIHRDNDLPAVIDPDCNVWVRHGLIHRDNDQPARVYADGTRVWYYYGEIHRENGKPNIVDARGNQRWW